jgi:hypothetical protein
VTLLYEAGTHHTATRGHYVNIGGYPSGGVYRGSHLTTSLLAQRLAPPEKRQPGNGCYAIPALFSVGFITTLFITTVKAFIFLDRAAERFLPHLYTIGIVGLPVLLVWATYKAHQMNQAYEQEVYRPRLAAWEQSYCCLCCGEPFIP